MLKDDIREYITKHPHKYSAKDIAQRFAIKPNKAHGIITREGVRDLIRKEVTGPKSTLKEFTMKKVSVNAYHHGKRKVKNRQVNTAGILIIGDLHEPFCREDYRDFCIATYRKYHCTHVVFIGDIIDNHFASYHEIDPDGHGGKHELDLAIQNVAKWVKAFPHADVTIGNHDRLILRKAFTGGIPSVWIRDFKDVLNAPHWNFTEEVIYDDVRYIHGEGPTARTRARKDLISTVQGHRHPEAYTEWAVGETFRIFGMQVGCGVNRKTYAMAYAKAHPKPAIGVGVILEHGQHPFNVLMPL